MTTKELYNEPKIKYGKYQLKRQEPQKIARYQIPHGPTALLVILFDLLLRLDPR
jgi:hypothetical protein